MAQEFAANETTAGDLMAAVSPSLFGGMRVVVIRDGQDAKKDLAAALLGYAASPESDVLLVVTHAGGAKGKALADGLRQAGAAVTNAAKITKHRDRVDFVRDEIRRLGGNTAAVSVRAQPSQGRMAMAPQPKLAPATARRSASSRADQAAEGVSQVPK